MPAPRKAPATSSDAAQLTLFAAMEVLPRGDGSYLLKPGRPLVMLTVRQAAKIMGISGSSVRRLFHAGEIDGEQPTPRKLLLDPASVEAHRVASRDREHWTTERREKMRLAKKDAPDAPLAPTALDA